MLEQIGGIDFALIGGIIGAGGFIGLRLWLDWRAGWRQWKRDTDRPPLSIPGESELNAADAIRVVGPLDRPDRWSR